MNEAQKAKARELVTLLWNTGRWSTQGELAEQLGTNQGVISRLTAPDSRYGTSVDVLIRAAKLAGEDVSGLLGLDRGPSRPVEFDARSRGEQILRLEEEYSEADIQAGSLRAAKAFTGEEGQRSARDWRNAIELEIRALLYRRASAPQPHRHRATTGKAGK